ncbi:putative phosphodiesterase [Bradyrhizobium sp. USDA 328]
MNFTIGIISDTHGLLRPEALRVLAHVGHIIHGGDIGDPEIITALRRIAPVTAIRGNVDTGEWATEFAETEFVRLAGQLFYVLHDLNTLQIDPVARPAQAGGAARAGPCRPHHSRRRHRHPEIITALRRIAPVTAIRGNVDTGEWATEFAETEFVRSRDSCSTFCTISTPCRSIPLLQGSMSLFPATPTCRRSTPSTACST